MYEKKILMNVPVNIVWDYLTQPDLMKIWMGGRDMKLEVESDWKLGGKLKIKGFQHNSFNNNGMILRIEPNKILQYSHLGVFSQLEDTPENYSVLSFMLESNDTHTLLILNILNFPTEMNYKHLEFFWNNALDLLKKTIEKAM
jgi:uncharacterized protein YndB with AHSA1/START domain